MNALGIAGGFRCYDAHPPTERALHIKDLQEMGRISPSKSMRSRGRLRIETLLRESDRSVICCARRVGGLPRRLRGSCTWSVRRLWDSVVARTPNR